MNKIMKGYSGDSILERTLYTKVKKTDKIESKHSVLELDVYNDTKNTRGRLWENIRKKIQKIIHG